MECYFLEFETIIIIFAISVSRKILGRMKISILKGCFGIACMLILCSTASFGHGVESDTILSENVQKDDAKAIELKKGYYSVIGVFDYLVNAQRFTDIANQKGITAKFGYVFEVKRYYVYTATSMDYEEIKNRKNLLRQTKEHSDAWVLRYQMESNALPTLVSAMPTKNAPSETVKSPANKATNVSNPSASSSGTESTTPNSVPTAEQAPLYKNYFLYIKMTSEASGKEVTGTVKLINTEKAKLLASIESNTPVNLNLPATENPNVEFVADIFGYQKLSVHLNLESLKASDDKSGEIKKEDDTLLVNLRLRKYKVGDVIVLYNVYFYDNSSVIRPVSKTQLMGVLDMLQENKHMQVNIHGHTNGDDHGEIIKMAEGDTTFFKVTPKNIRTNGSAVTLSNERALTIKRWLIYNGVDPKRLDTKAWGGKKKLYDHPLDYAKNIRVELEIIKDQK